MTTKSRAAQIEAIQAEIAEVEMSGRREKVKKTIIKNLREAIAELTERNRKAG